MAACFGSETTATPVFPMSGLHRMAGARRAAEAKRIGYLTHTYRGTSHEVLCILLGFFTCDAISIARSLALLLLSLPLH